MNHIISKEQAKEIMSLAGETRGFNIKLDSEYILKTKGEEGLKKLEQEMEKLGYPIKYKEIQRMGFVPSGLKILTLLTIKQVFGFDDEEIKNVCGFQPTNSLIVKLFAVYIRSMPIALKFANTMWKKYWTIGELKSVEFNEEKKRIVLIIKNFKLHDIFCRCMEGYFESMAGLIFGKKNMTCKETKCSHKGDEFHEFLLTWKD